MISLLQARTVGFCGLLTLLPQHALAEAQLSYLLGMSLGVREIDFGFTSTGGPSFVTLNQGQGPILSLSQGSDLSFSFEESLYTAGFSGTVIYDRFHVSVLAELPVTTQDMTLHARSVPEVNTISGAVSDNERDSRLDAFDFSLTLGYRVWKGLSIFSGYKYSEFELESLEYNFLLNDKNHKYAEEGLFIGGSYSWQIGTAGTLSISAAYAALDTEFSETNIAPEPPPLGSSFGEFNFTGASSGLSYGVQWSGLLTAHWIYNIALKHQSYRSENNATNLDIYLGDNLFSQDLGISSPAEASAIPVSNIDTEHTDTSIFVGILYRF